MAFLFSSVKSDLYFVIATLSFQHERRESAPRDLLLATLNRDFEQVLRDLERLEELRLFRYHWQREFLKVWRATLEETRAWVSFKMVEILHQKRNGTGPISAACASGQKNHPSPPCQSPPKDARPSPPAEVTRFDEPVRNGTRAACQR
jgi:hypothetical protein